MNDKTLVQKLASFASDTRFDDLPKDVIESVKLRIIDTLGISLAAWPLDQGKAVFTLVKKAGGTSEAAPIGTSKFFPTEQAAFVNGVLAHSLDFDDTHLPSILHPSAIIIPTALSVGMNIGASGRDIITAAAVGYEICIRVGMAAFDKELHNSVFFEKGLHGASICGALGAAAVASKLYSNTATTIADSLGIVSSMAAGLLEANRTGGTVKQIHGGWACHAGVWASKLAGAGFTGPPTVFEGRFGFFHALCDNKFNAKSFNDVGESWETPNIFFKPYPSNHFTHAGIDAALALKKEYDIEDPTKIEKIELGVATPTLRTIAQPREAKIHPESGYAARFSGPFTIAAALLGGGGLGVYLDDFSDNNAKSVLYNDLATKVHCFSDPKCDSIFPYHFPAILRIRFTGGSTIEKRVMKNRGSRENPLSQEEVYKKFKLNASPIIGEEQVQILMDTNKKFECLNNVKNLVHHWQAKQN